MKLLLTGAFPYTEEQIEYIGSLGYEVTFYQDERIPIPFDVSDIEAVVCNGLFLYTPIERFKSLKLIQLTSAGLDRAPLDYICEHGIQLFNARGVYSIPMAEFALSGVLALYKQLPYFIKNKGQHLWEKHRGLLELAGKTVCIVGAGSIGCECAKRFKAFDTVNIGVDLYPKENAHFDIIKPINELEGAICEADIVILTLPLIKENEGFFNSEKFKRMKPNAIFVNISRGKLVNEADLITALKTKMIGGAVLDVFALEPLSEGSPLWKMENALISPHNSFVGENNNVRMFELACSNLKEYLRESK